jgi:prepilin-type N-terminal cleavage/methylation domain-containing protein
VSLLAYTGFFMKRNSFTYFSRAFTLIELMISITIVAILVGIVFYGSGEWIKRARAAKCTANLKSLHLGFDLYTREHNNVWPQLDLNSSQHNKFWFNTLEPYQVTKETWLCPVHAAELKMLPKEEQEEYPSSYSPTAFDDTPNVPYHWLQPWVIESGDFHGQGALMIMPDGSVQLSPFHGVSH